MIAISHDDLYFSPGGSPAAGDASGQLTELTGERREQVSRDAVAHLDTGFECRGAGLNPANRNSFMFEMKAASFTVNDRQLLHPPACASRQVRSMVSSATTAPGKSTLLQAAGPPAALER